MSDDARLVDIPNKANWPLRSVSDLCTLTSRGTAPVYVEHSEIMAIGQRCVSASGFAPEFSRPHSKQAMLNVLRPEPGDVLLNSTGTGTIGRSVVFGGSDFFIVDGHVTVLRPKKEITDGHWLNSVLRTPWLQRHLERFCYSGSTNQLELNRTPLRESHLPTPHFDEQRCISQILSTLDTAIQETGAIIAKLKAVKQGLLHDLLTRGIDANGELRPPQAEAPHQYKASPLGWIPNEWHAKQLANITTLITSGSRGWAAHYAEDGDFFIRSQNVRMGYLDFSELQCVMPPVDGEGQRTRLDELDLLITITGNGVGNVAHMPFGWTDTAFVSQHVGLVRFAEPQLARLVTQFLVQGAPGNRQLLDAQYGQSKPGLNLNDLRSLCVPIPPPEERAIIIERLEGIQERIQAEHLAANQNSAMKFGLMDDLLTGRVRVTSLLEPAA